MNDLRAPTTPDCALLGFRLLVALLIGIHGWYRLHAGASPAFGDWLATQGTPMPHALCVRPFALLFIAIYATGIVLVHAPDGWFVVGPGRNGMEYSVLLIGSLMLVAWRIRTPLRDAFRQGRAPAATTSGR